MESGSKVFHMREFSTKGKSGIFTNFVVNFKKQMGYFNVCICIYLYVRSERNISEHPEKYKNCFDKYLCTPSIKS